MEEICVSVIIPCYNQGEYLSETLESVRKQTCKEWECIIVDDGSTDNSKEIAFSFCQEDPRFRYIYQDNQGPAAARNRGIINSTGKYILPLDGDDIIHEDYLFLASNILKDSKSTKVVYCRAEFMGNMSGEWLLPEFSLERMSIQNCIFCCAMFRREDYNKAIGFNTNMKYGLEDWDFWISLLKTGGDVYRIPKILFYYRQHSGYRVNTTLLENDDKRSMAMHQLVMNHPDFFFSQHRLLFEKYNDIVGSRFWNIIKLWLRFEKLIDGIVDQCSNCFGRFRISFGALRKKYLGLIMKKITI